MAKRFDPKAKARKQKIVAAGLGVVFLGVLVFQAPTIMSLFKGSSSTAASEPAPPPPPAAAPVPGAATPVATPAAGSAQLVDSDVPPEPTPGQLVTFDRFESKDPFAQQAEEDPTAEKPAAPAPRDEGPNPGVIESAPPPPSPPPVRQRASTATISVNGVSSKVTVGGAFPDGEPIFKLVSLRKGSAKVGVVGGTYATGAPTITLKRGGKPVTLMNTADGTTYVLRLLHVT